MARTITLSVPSTSSDIAIANAAMKLLSEQSEPLGFSPTMVPEGKYEIVLLVHARRTDHSPILIH